MRIKKNCEKQNLDISRDISIDSDVIYIYIDLDIKNVYEYFKSIINFLDSCDSCDSMLDAISEYENEMRSYVEW